ncbi:GtrA family protein [Xylophilus ampelinus]|nr:GtrA family protein [Xylophilus ampelinus]MCS4510487.1 GtrA family protein [Xylophilus ampelinus]
MSARPALRQFLIFCAVGTLGFVVDAAVLYALAPWLGWYGGRVLSFWAAATTTWLFNRHFTFPGTRATGSGSGIWREYGKYLVTMLGGAALNYGAYVAVLHWYHGPYAALIGVAAGSIAGLVANFASARYVVFRARPAVTEPR